MKRLLNSLTICLALLLSSGALSQASAETHCTGPVHHTVNQMSLNGMSHAASVNFIAYAPTKELAIKVAERAEECRYKIAQKWLGKPLPHNWNKPCKVYYEPADRSSGLTTMQFSNGEVFGWNMVVKGTEKAIIDSIIPHEVSHTIFACHFRAPSVRWADEGAAMQVEADAELLPYNQTLKEISLGAKRIPFDKLLSMRDYPQDGRATFLVYCQGYSLTEFLLEREESGSEQKFLAFLAQANTKGWSSAFRDHYGFDSISHAEERWMAWLVKRYHDNPSDVYPEADAADITPTGGFFLYRFTAPYCGPCNLYKSDKQGDPQFAKEISSRCTEVEINVNEMSAFAEALEVTDVPTFIVMNKDKKEVGRWVGYPSKQHFLSHLTKWCPFTPFLPSRPRTKSPTWEPATDGTIERGEQLPDRAPDLRDHDPNAVDWSKVKLVVLIPEQISSPVLGLGADFALDRITSTLEQKFFQKTEGKGELIVVPERTQPNRYAAVCDIIGPPIGLAHAVVMVDQEVEGIKGLFVGIGQYVLQSKFSGLLSDKPVTVMFQRQSWVAYQYMLAALSTREGFNVFGVNISDWFGDPEEWGLFGIMFLVFMKVFRILKIGLAARRVWRGGLEKVSKWTADDEDGTAPISTEVTSVTEPEPKVKASSKKTPMKTAPPTKKTAPKKPEEVEIS